MYLAMFKGDGNFIDYLIRKRTKSQYSHVELVIDIDEQDNMLCLSSKPMHGVRCDLIRYNKQDWELIEIDERRFNTREQIFSYYYETKGAWYDYLGVLAFICKTEEDPRKYFCSEWIGRALGIKDSNTLTPYDLYSKVKYLNNI